MLQGNPGKRPLPKTGRRANPRRRTPPPPEWLPEDGRAEWVRVGRLLNQLHVLTEADNTALAAYCDAYSRWRKARKLIEDDGMTTTTAAGNLKAHPATVVVHQAMTEMRQFMIEFGLTPSSRARVGQVPAAEPSEFEKYLARRNQQAAAADAERTGTDGG